MRAKTGRVATLTAVCVLGAVMFGNAVTASPPEPEPQPEIETTTTTIQPLVVDEPGITPGRGTQSQVTETVPPPSTTTTLPPTALPLDSGDGKRIVYSKPRQRVWVVEGDGTVSKTHAVSGRLKYNQPTPGTYHVFSKSMNTCNIKKPWICWRYMVRFAYGGDEGDNIGFHEIPKENGVPVQSESQLGIPLSGGCVRQRTEDAVYIWNWAPVGTKVVVLG
jgi:lipoprotein-anchoring transpeptidase ErfK/SrfK